MNMIVCDSSSYSCHSALPIIGTMIVLSTLVWIIPAPFGSAKLELPELGWYTPAPITVLPFWIDSNHPCRSKISS